MYKASTNLLALLLSAVFFSCGDHHEEEQKATEPSSEFVSITSNEDKGVKEVIALYNGNCKYAVGKANGKRYFELELSKSEKVQKYAPRAEVLGSNIAYIFFHNLKSEMQNYDEIHTVLLFNRGNKMTFSYSLDTLKIIDAKYAALRNAVALIAKNEFDSLKQLFDKDKMSASLQKATIENLEKYQPILGQIEQLIPYGFKFFQMPDGKSVLHLSGIVTRTKQNNEIGIDLSAEPGNDKIWKLNYKL